MTRLLPRALAPLSLVLVLPPAVAQRLPDPAAALPPGAPPGLERVDANDLLGHATWLADDERGGRMTGSPGQEDAARYVAEHFAALGLEPFGDKQPDGTRSWFQEYPIVRQHLERPELRLGGGGGGGGVEGEGEGEVITAGFSVMPASAAEDLDLHSALVLVDPSQELPDLRDAVAVAVLKAPKLPTTDINALFSSSLASVVKARGLARRVAKAGAKAIVLCLLDDGSGMATALGYFALAPGQDQLAFGGDEVDIGMGLGAMAEQWKANVPQLFTGAVASRNVLAAFGVEDAGAVAAAHGRRIDGGVRIAVRTDEGARARNVVALLRGRDAELAQEAVIYSAHHDHVGRRIDGDVFNGADDNASGTAGLLDIAQAYAQTGERPRRSVLFLSVSGEELGLWGSKWFADHPTWDAARIVADVNTDMIGRTGPESAEDEVMVTPSWRHAMFSTMVRDAAELRERLGVTFTSGDKYWARSDHYNFAKRGIPVVFFCNGEHEDYHQVSDTADKLDAAKMERIARLAYWVGRNAAEADGRPAVLGACRDWSGRKE